MEFLRLDLAPVAHFKPPIGRYARGGNSVLKRIPLAIAPQDVRPWSTAWIEGKDGEGAHTPGGESPSDPCQQQGKKERSFGSSRQGS
jgi:hypothetical protein